jgi:hypothetical protein
LVGEVMVVAEVLDVVLVVVLRFVVLLWVDERR